MAGAAGSVASSSAMSSVDPNHRDNVFDRVLNMVMAEEHERLSAMGMSRADPKSDAVKLASKKKKAVAATATTPPVVVVEAPRGGPALELDTSMDVEYHDRNDEGVPEERWTKLNDAAIASGMQNLSFDSSNSSHQGSDSSPSHSRLRRGINMMKGHQPTNEGKKMKKTDLKPDDWVDFDNKNNSEGSKRNEKSGTIRRVNDLASF